MARNNKLNGRTRAGLLSPGRHKIIVEHLRAGHYRSVAADAAGVSRVSLWTWLRRGEAGEEPYAALYLEVTAAEAEAEAEALANVRVAAREDWRAAAWYLEKKARKRYGDVRANEIVDELLGVLERVCRANQAEHILAAVLTALEAGDQETGKPVVAPAPADTDIH
jgi:hypothetical protein